MLKLFGIRSWIGLAAVLVVAAAILVAHDRLAAWWTGGQLWGAVGKDDDDWRQRELVFLKQLYDRLEVERAAQRGRVPASQREEQETILRRMEQTAGPIRAKVPPEIRALLRDEPAPQAEKAPLPQPAPVAAAVATPPAELRVGSAPFPSTDVDLDGLTRDPTLDHAMERLRPRKPAPAKTAEAKPNPSATEPADKPKQ